MSHNWVAHQREGLGKQGSAIDKPVTAVIEALLNTSLGLIRGFLCPLSGMEHDNSDHSLQRIAFSSCSNTPVVNSRLRRLPYPQSRCFIFLPWLLPTSGVL